MSRRLRHKAGGPDLLPSLLMAMAQNVAGLSQEIHAPSPCHPDPMELSPTFPLKLGQGRSTEPLQSRSGDLASRRMRLVGPQNDRERRPPQRAGGYCQQCQFLIIGSHAIGTEHSAGDASVNQLPFIPPADPDGDGLHQRSAVCGPVAWLKVQVQAKKAPGAVVSLLGSATFPGDEGAAVPA